MIRRLLAIVTVLAAAAVAVVLTGADSDSGKGKTYRVAFDNAFGLTEGGDLRVGGVKAGQTVKFDLSDQNAKDPVRALVEVQVTEPGFGSFRKDAYCEIRQQSLIGEYFVDCQPGRAEEELPENGIVPIERTASTIPTDLVNNVLRRPYRERLRLIIAELGAGLAGRPDDLREALRRAHPGLRETIKTLDLLADQKEIIKDFISDSDTVVAELEAKKKEVARFVTEAGNTAEISASRKADLAGGFRRLPGFLRELEPTMARLGELSDAQVPLLGDLERAAPDLDRFFTELGPFSEASRPAFRSLGRASVTGRRALAESADEIDELNKLAKDAPRVARPLRQFLQSLDDRRRAVQPEPNSRELAPPTPDKTSYAGAKAAQNPTMIPGQGNEGQTDGQVTGGSDKEGQVDGYTGFESFWNYAFQQTLAINAFDSVSHLLRVFLVEGKTSEECAPYAVDPPKELQEECGGYLGPYQPGLTEAFDGKVDKDPTEPGARALAARDGGDAKRRGAGDPEAPPIPGRPDPSKPQIVLPPAVQELRERLLGSPKAVPPKLPDTATPAPDQLLDFLLAP